MPKFRCKLEEITFKDGKPLVREGCFTDDMFETKTVDDMLVEDMLQELNGNKRIKHRVFEGYELHTYDVIVEFGDGTKAITRVRANREENAANMARDNYYLVEGKGGIAMLLDGLKVFYGDVTSVEVMKEDKDVQGVQL